jgi:hypothetical protein
MPLLAPDLRTETTAAERLSRQYWESNCRALARTQPAVAELLNEVQLDLEWVFARDGSLSALENGRWWADCSVPLLAGRSLLRSLPDEAVGSCQLLPAHAGLVRAARERMGACPVLFLTHQDARVARVILSCHDFSEQIDRHRLWIAAGPAWVDYLEQIFSDFPGLATPMRFIRTRLTTEEMTLPMITAIQGVFSKVLAVRGEEVVKLKAEPSAQDVAKKILLVGGSEFRLWEFGTILVERQLTARAESDGLTIQRFDMDDALSGSPLALLRAAREHGCVVAADVCRADCNQLLSPEIAWITWLTQPGAPPFDTAGPRDALILADEKWRPIARVAGWPAARVRVCGWPVNPPQSSSAGAWQPDGLMIPKPVLRYSEGPDSLALDPGPRSTSGPGLVGPKPGVKPPQKEKELGFVCDTRKVQIPTSVSEFSSHRLLWELIEEELAANPLAVEDVEAYLSNRASQLNIANDALDRRRFAEELILPAYQQGLARLLISAGVSIRLWGNGWGDLPEFAKRTGGAISNQIEFDEVLGKCCGLVYCWPTRAAHPIEMTGKPVVYRSGMDRSALVREARRVIGAAPRKMQASGGDQLAKVILELTQKVEH